MTKQKDTLTLKNHCELSHLQNEIDTFQRLTALMIDDVNKNLTNKNYKSFLNIFHDNLNILKKEVINAKKVMEV